MKFLMEIVLLKKKFQKKKENRIDENNIVDDDRFDKNEIIIKNDNINEIKDEEEKENSDKEFTCD